MAEPMTLRDEDVGRIGEYVKPWLRQMMDEMVPSLEPVGADTRLIERMVRVEEELKAQRMLMDERFAFMARRFDVVDRRFEDLIGHTNTRFEAVDKRFVELIGHTNTRFEELIGQMNARFDTVDRRFEESHAHTNSRFRMLTWMIGVGFAVITSLTTLFALLS
ncbi:MAG: hypothetical protein OXJ90_23185 [Spirochaetaceae bacterium]|nr:hypothetical protein [Spirochaetaceae bacterium]